MTLEHRLLVGFDEIKAVVFECNTCKTRTSVPIGKFDAPLAVCPQGHRWVTDKPMIPQGPAFHALAFLLARVAQVDEHGVGTAVQRDGLGGLERLDLRQRLVDELAVSLHDLLRHGVGLPLLLAWLMLD